MFISTFTGYMFASFGAVLGVSEQVRILFAGLGGYMGTRSIDFIEDYFKKKFNETSSPQ